MNEFEAMVGSRRGACTGRRKEEEEQERRSKRKGRSQEHQNKGGEDPKDAPDKQKDRQSRIIPFESPSTHPPKNVFGARRYLQRVLKREERKIKLHVRITSQGNPIPNARHNRGRRGRSLTIPKQIKPAAITTRLVHIPCTWRTAIRRCRVCRTGRQGVSTVCTMCVQKSAMDASKRLLKVCCRGPDRESTRKVALKKERD